MENWTPRAVKYRSDPAIGAVAISYGGGNQTISQPSRAIYISGAGALVVTMVDGSAATFSGLLAGVVYPFSIQGITQSGSSAAGVILL